MLTGTGRTFTAWLTERHYSPATVHCYVGYVQRAEHAVGALDAASSDGLYDWWTTLPPGSSSRNGARKALLAFYRSTGARTGGPALELPVLPAPDAHPRPVAGAAFARLRAAAAQLGGAHQAAAVLLATTGCRVGEARVARWDQFCLDAPASWRIVGKGSRQRGPKTRQVPLTETAVGVLRDWHDDCGSTQWVFPSKLRAGPVAEQTMRRRVYDIATAAGVGEHVNPHRWRHTAATAALAHCHDLAAVQDMLGHADPATTRRYTLVGFDRMRTAVEGADAYGRPRLTAVN